MVIRKRCNISLLIDSLAYSKEYQISARLYNMAKYVISRLCYTHYTFVIGYLYGFSKGCKWKKMRLVFLTTIMLI